MPHTCPECGREMKSPTVCMHCATIFEQAVPGRESGEHNPPGRNPPESDPDSGNSPGGSTPPEDSSRSLTGLKRLLDLHGQLDEARKNTEYSKVGPFTAGAFVFLMWVLSQVAIFIIPRMLLGAQVAASIFDRAPLVLLLIPILVALATCVLLGVRYFRRKSVAIHAAKTRILEETGKLALEHPWLRQEVTGDLAVESTVRELFARIASGELSPPASAAAAASAPDIPKRMPSPSLRASPIPVSDGARCATAPRPARGRSCPTGGQRETRPKNPSLQRMRAPHRRQRSGAGRAPALKHRQSGGQRNSARQATFTMHAPITERPPGLTKPRQNGE